MDVTAQIDAYIAGLSEPKRGDMVALNGLVLQVLPACRLWFLDGKNSDGKVVSNPNIGYGFKPILYADGKTKDFYQIGLSANSTGISIYILGIKDKNYLSQTYGEKIGKASISGYCIKFKKLSDVNIDIVLEIFKFAANTTSKD